MNPELRRSLWTELTPHRSILAALVTGAAFWLAWVIDGPDAMHGLALIVFIGAGLIWGSFQAAGALREELSERTWDGQRLCAMTPGAMALGKLAGAPVFSNIIALIALAIYAATHPSGYRWDEVALHVAQLAGTAALAQAAALFAGGQAAASTGESGGRMRVAAFVAFGLAAGAPFFLSAFLVWPFDETLVDIRIWGFTSLALPVLVALAWIYWAWAALGLRDAMKRELGALTGPGIWLGFLVFSLLLAAGTEPVGEGSDAAGRLARTLGVAALACYLSAFVTVRDAVGLRRWLGAGKRGEWARFWRDTPGWIFPSVLILPVALSYAGLHGSERPELATLSAAAGFTVLRDVGVIVLIGVMLRKRADIAAVVYLLMLHGLIPGLLGAAGVGVDMVALLSPRPGAAAWTALAPAVEAVVVFAFVALRVMRRR